MSAIFCFVKRMCVIIPTTCRQHRCHWRPSTSSIVSGKCISDKNGKSHCGKTGRIV